MKTRRSGILYFILLLSHGLAFSQIPFEKLETEVAVELTMDIIRDDLGYVWMANGGLGLVRHNSYNSLQYRHNPNDTSSICDNSVHCLHQDRKRNLWIGTRQGLSRYVREKNNFVSYFSNKYDTTSLSSNMIRAIFEDSQGQLWLITAKGINRYNYENNSFTRYADLPLNDGYFEYSSMVQDTLGNYWVVGTHNGIYQFDPVLNKFIYYNDLANINSSSNLKKVYVDNKNNIWIGSKSLGLSLFDPKRATFKHFDVSGDYTGTNGNIVYDILQEDDEHLLIAVDQGGVNRYSYQSKKFNYITTKNSRSGNLSSDGIYCFYKDTEDILWIGTSRGGVNFYNPKKHRFKTFRQEQNDMASSLAFNIIGCMHEDSENNIWIGTDGGGISVFNRKSQTFKNYSHNPNDPNSLSSNVIRSIREDSSGRIWIATFDKGINTFNKTTQTFSRVPIKIYPKKGTETINSFLIDKKDRTWIGLPHGAILLLDKNQNETTRYFQSASKHTRRRPLIVETQTEQIFLLINEGVFLFSEEDYEVKKVINQPDITALYEDESGDYYIGTMHQGVLKYDFAFNFIRKYDESDGLAYNTVSQILSGNDGSIWVSTMNGLSAIHPDNKLITNYYELDGLQGNFFFLQSACKTKDGELFFGGTQGFSSFYPDSIKVNRTTPPVHIEAFYLSKERISPGSGSVLKNDIGSTDEIRLNWRQNVFSFEFAAINYTYPLKNHYLYKLEGFDDNWIPTNAMHRSANYTNIDPGEYVFKVLASNNDNFMNEQAAEVRIIIIPPLWKKGWFHIVLALIGTSAMYFYVLSRLRRLKRDKTLLQEKVDKRTRLITEQHDQLNRQNKQLENQTTELEIQKEELTAQKEELKLHRNKLKLLVEERTHDLELALKKAEESDKLKTSFLANMSHEIRTPMNAILGFSGLLEDECYSKEDRNKFISLIQSNSSALHHLIQDILDLSMIETDHLPIRKLSFNLNDFINEIYSSYLHYENDSDVKLLCQNDIEEYDYSIISDESRIRQILTNLLNNGLKFTDKGFVKLGLTWIDEEIIFYVKDTGKGINKEGVDVIFNQFVKLEKDNTEFTRGAGLGLSISKKLSDLLGGELKVLSEPGTGTEFRFCLPISLLENFEKNKPNKLSNKTPAENWEERVFLVAEDEKTNYEFLHEILKRTKAKILWAQNGLEAVQLFSITPNIDIVLLDIKMPVLNGYETIKKIRTINPEQVVIAQTAYVYKQDKEKILLTGFNDYVSKPINPAKLFNTIKKYLTRPK